MWVCTGITISCAVASALVFVRLRVFSNYYFSAEVFPSSPFIVGWCMLRNLYNKYHTFSARGYPPFLILPTRRYIHTRSSMSSAEGDDKPLREEIRKFW